MRLAGQAQLDKKILVYPPVHPWEYDDKLHVRAIEAKQPSSSQSEMHRHYSVSFTH